MISKKQMQILAFPYTKYDALICDGAIRSGKTSIMTIAFIDWAMREFHNTNFAICGKTVGSAIKNIIVPYISLDYSKKYSCNFTRSDNKLIVTCGNKMNTFYVYGGKDESSYQLIQGITLGGVLLDEVALMTRSFVEQALARCSVQGSKFWFNCNPASPNHWFFKEWVCKKTEKNSLYIHFELTDNPSLTQKIVERYSALYSGVFYNRYILGQWALAEGLVYGNFSRERNVSDIVPNHGDYYISIDYGIVNPFSAHLWCVSGGKAYCIDEYYYNSRDEATQGRQRTDEEHYCAIEKLAGNRQIEYIVIDPSASSMKETIRRHDRFYIRNAINDVINGISACMTLLDTDRIKFSNKCECLINEFGLYSWNASSAKDEVIKENDHAMDDFRYFVNTVLRYEFSDINWDKGVSE